MNSSLKRQCPQRLGGADVGDVVVVASVQRVHPPAAALTLVLLQPRDALLDARVARGHAAFAQQDDGEGGHVGIAPRIRGVG